MASPRHAVALQRTIGNAALTQILQRQPATDDRLSALELQAKRLANKDRAKGHLDSFKEDVMLRATGWERAILKLGSAYTLAAKNHTDAVEQKKKIDAIRSQAMFSVLTVASAGGLAWVSGGVQAAKGAADEGALLTNVLEDVLQTTASEVLSGNAPGIHQRVPSPDQTTVSTEPLVFQNQRMDRLLAAKESAHKHFKTLADAFLATPEKDWDHYDEAKQVAGYREWFSKADLLAADAKLPSIDEMARELERGFWAKWAPGLRTTYVPSAERITGRNKEMVEYTSPSTPVEKRLDAVGITKDCGIDDFGWWTSDEEIQKFIDWARGYEVKPFVA